MTLLRLIIQSSSNVSHETIMVKGVIFDFNGTLIIDRDINEIAWRKTIDTLSEGKVDFDVFFPPFASVKDTVVLRSMYDLLDESHTEEELNELAEYKERNYRACIIENNRTSLRDNVVKVFEYLKEHNIPINIATSSIKSNVDFYFETYGLSKYFDKELIAYDDGKYLDKVEMYRDAAKAIGVDIKDCVVFEDSPKSMREALEAGCQKAVAITINGDMHRSEIKQYIQSYDELDYSVFED